MPRAIEGYSLQVFVTGLGSLFGTAILVVPVVVAIVLTRHVAASVRMPALLAGSAVYGLLLATIGVRVTAGIAKDRIPELAEIALRSKV